MKKGGELFSFVFFFSGVLVGFIEFFNVLKKVFKVFRVLKVTFSEVC